MEWIRIVDAIFIVIIGTLIAGIKYYPVEGVKQFCLYIAQWLHVVFHSGIKKNLRF